MVVINEPLIIKTDSPRAAEWVKQVKEYKHQQLELMRRVAELEKEMA